jgi:hypothetical protein
MLRRQDLFLIREAQERAAGNNEERRRLFNRELFSDFWNGRPVLA